MPSEIGCIEIIPDITGAWHIGAIHKDLSDILFLGVLLVGILGDQMTVHVPAHLTTPSFLRTSS